MLFVFLVWMFEDLRLMVFCWGMILLCLILLMNVNCFWKVLCEFVKLLSMIFLCGWFVFVGVIVIIYIVIGEWCVF